MPANRNHPPPPLKIQGRTGSLNPGPEAVSRSAQHLAGVTLVTPKAGGSATPQQSVDSEGLVLTLTGRTAPGFRKAESGSPP